MSNGLLDATKSPELRKRLLFTLGMLAVYRLGVHVSAPGIDVAALRRMFDAGSGSLFGLVNMFSGGALENFSIFTLGVAPYISVSIIMQILTASIPALETLKKDGEAGQRIITRYTRQITVLLALFQGFMIAVGLEGQGLVMAPGLLFRLTTALTLCTGTVFIMWLGEQITERGIGNGISIIIFAGIVARMPNSLLATFALAKNMEIEPITVLALLLFSAMTIFGIVYVERSFRKIPVQYPRRMVGNRLAQAQTQYLPLKLNMTGVIPPIFASAVLVLPATVASFSTNKQVHDLTKYFMPGSATYSLIFVALIVVFCYFYAAMIVNPQDIAENLKKNGGSVPTIRPGKPTEDFIYGVLNRMTIWGALYISAICVIPQAVYFELGAGNFAYIFGGTAILIVVGVTLDTVSQIESIMVARNYDAFMSKSIKMRGGVGAASAGKGRLLRR